MTLFVKLHHVKRHYPILHVSSMKFSKRKPPRQSQ